MSQLKRKKCQHGNYLCELCVNVSDEAKRFSDGVNGLLSFHQPWEVRHHWLAVHLGTGSVSSTVYDTKEAALKDQHHDESNYFFFPVGNFMQGLKPTDAECILELSRHAYDAGMRFKQDDAPPELIMPTTSQDMFRSFLRAGGAVVR